VKAESGRKERSGGRKEGTEGVEGRKQGKDGREGNGRSEGNDGGK
jgi:hypothetical protein